MIRLVGLVLLVGLAGCAEAQNASAPSPAVIQEQPLPPIPPEALAINKAIAQERVRRQQNEKIQAANNALPDGEHLPWTEQKVTLFQVLAPPSPGQITDAIELREGLQQQGEYLLNSGSIDELEQEYAQKLQLGQTHMRTGHWFIDLFRSGFVRSITRDPGFERSTEVISRWRTSHPQSCPAGLAWARLLRAKAFAARGGEYAAKTPKENMDAFHDLMEVYLKHMMSIREMCVSAKDPNWDFELITQVAILDAPRESVFGLIEEADQLAPGDAPFTPAYDAVNDVLLPQWGGTPEALEFFADWAADRTYRQSGQSLYARTYWNFLEATKNNTDLTKNDLNLKWMRQNLDWPRMKQGLSDIVTMYPDPMNIQHVAILSCIQKDKEAFTQIFPQAKATYEERWWQEHKMECMDCVRWAGLEEQKEPASVSEN